MPYSKILLLTHDGIQKFSKELNGTNVNFQKIREVLWMLKSVSHLIQILSEVKPVKDNVFNQLEMRKKLTEDEIFLKASQYTVAECPVNTMTEGCPTNEFFNTTVRKY